MPTRSIFPSRSSWLSVLVLAVVGAAALATVPAEAAPDMALKDVMKKMNAQVLNGDAKALAPLFDATKSKGRPEFSSWNAISDRGKAAAASGNLDGAKATCKECHDAYRNDYKQKYGSKAP
jgi:soluble cytochrome b562